VVLARRLARGAVPRLAPTALLACAASLACTAPPPKPPVVEATAPVETPSAAAQRTPCEQARELRDQVPAHLAQGRLDRTLRAIEFADRLCPAEAPQTWGWQVTTLADVGRWAEARALAAKIEAATDAPVDAKPSAASVLKRLEKLERSPIDLAAARALSRKLAFEAQDAAAKGQHAVAQARFRDAWEALHPNGAALSGAGLAARAAGDPVEAQRLLDRAVVDYEKETGGKLELDVPNGFGGFVSSLAWGAQGRLLAVAHRGVVSLVDALTLRERLRLRGHAQTVTSIAFSSDARYVVSGSRDESVRIWDAATGRELKKLDGHGGDVNAVALADDGTLASAGADKTVRLWDVETGTPRVTLTGHTASVTALSFSRDGKTLYSASSDKTVIVWDVNGAKQRARIAATAPLRAVAAGPFVATGGEDPAIKLFAMNGGDALKSLEGHGSALTVLAFEAAGPRLASGGIDGVVRLWDSTTGGALGVLDGHDVFPLALAWTRDGKRLASSGYNTVHVWDPSSRAELSRLSGHAQAVNALAWAPSGKGLALGSMDRTLRLFGPSARRLDAHGGPVTAVAFSPSGAVVATGSTDGTLRRWNLATGNAGLPIEDVGSVQSLAWSSDGRYLAAASPERSIRLFDAVNGAPVGPDVPGPGAYSVAFSPDGAHLVFAAIGKLAVVRHVASGKEVARLTGHAASVNAVAWSADGATIATASSDKTVKLWDGRTFAPLDTLETGEPVQTVSLRPLAIESIFLAAGTSDGAVHLFKRKRAKPVMRLAAHGDAVLAASFSPDGAWLASGARDGTTQLFSMPDGQLRVSLRAVDGRDAGYAFTPGGDLELFGDARDFPICRVGPLSVPFELCEERYVEVGLLGRILR
jgi:WD40 repeat protein